MPGKHGKRPLLFTGSSKDYERIDGRFAIGNNRILTTNGSLKLQNSTGFKKVYMRRSFMFFSSLFRVIQITAEVFV